MSLDRCASVLVMRKTSEAYVEEAYGFALARSAPSQ